MRMEESEVSSERPPPLRARVVIIGPAGAVEQLTYEIPPALAQHLMPGHRVLVPLRSRRITGMVVEVGKDLDSGDAVAKSILEVLEPRPLFDRAHLELIQFLATYYMTPLGEAYRAVIPAAARVESRRMFQLGATPGPLAQAVMTSLERAIIDALAKRPLALRQIQRLGDPKVAEAALARLVADGFVDRHDATRGRHRQGVTRIVRLTMEGPLRIRSPRQREILLRLAEAGQTGIRLDQLEKEIAGAKTVLRTMAGRGIVELATPEFIVGERLSPDRPGERPLSLPVVETALPAEGHLGSPSFERGASKRFCYGG
jgi:primosomal protein N' (replication factor Y) (superfamily II helicase)